MAFKIYPVWGDVPQNDDPEMGIPELPNWGTPTRRGSVGSNLRRFKPLMGGAGAGYNMGANQAEGDLRGIINAAMGSTRSFDTAANRLRERVDAAGQSQKASATQGMRGLAGSGMGRTRMDQIDQNSLFSYGQGLADLESEFEGHRLQGLNTALGAANSLQGWSQFANELGQRDLSQIRDLSNQGIRDANQIGFQRASSIDDLEARSDQSSRANSLQMMLEQIRDRRERDIAEGNNRTQLQLGRRSDLSRLLELIGGL